MLAGLVETGPTQFRRDYEARNCGWPSGIRALQILANASDMGSNSRQLENEQTSGEMTTPAVVLAQADPLVLLQLSSANSFLQRSTNLSNAQSLLRAEQAAASCIRFRRNDSCTARTNTPLRNTPGWGCVLANAGAVSGCGDAARLARSDKRWRKSSALRLTNYPAFRGTLTGPSEIWSLVALQPSPESQRRTVGHADAIIGAF